MENFQKIAVLIDADNTQLSKLEAVLHEVSTYGRIVVKKAYGNWRKDSLKNWEPELKRLAIRAEQQFDYVTGKNTTDIAMVIGAMDLLHNNMYDALVLVSSDSDYTRLASRIRESGREVLGFLQKLNQEGDTVVLITHDNSIAVQAQRIIRLEDGRVVYDGDARAPEAIVQPTLNFEPAEQEGDA